ncbi:MAG: hypothetical protein JJU06_04490 [Ectothiorhodospiraceae bacterium]|nr:hypothetical protein [Ectothiorhodospiraceae bacterium]MCH8503344.1 hypothetical protein [Ectothiorhodospiraceae bacterium]
MFRSMTFRPAIAGTAALCAPAVMASGQYVVQDAELIDQRSVEMELWHSDYDEANFLLGTFRDSMPFQLTAEVEMPRFERELFALEGKWLFRDIATHGYGLGLFGGAVYDTETNEVEEGVLLVPFTVEAIADRMMLHLNVGVTHVRDGSDTDPFWGVATEMGLFGPVEAVAEVFGNTDDDPTVQGGLRLMLLDDQVSLDVSYLKELESGGVSGWAAGIGFEALRF